jgi:hypothetical protein
MSMESSSKRIHVNKAYNDKNYCRLVEQQK